MRVTERLVGTAALALAPAWRRHLGAGDAFRVIGITGSAGKTTTTRMLAACLGTLGPVSHTDRLVGRLNNAQTAARHILATRRHHRFCLYEMGAGGPGTMQPYIDIIRPHVGVVINVAGDHYTAFRGLDETAREKGTLVEALPADGIAVLNADDPRVAAMRTRTRAKVVTYGFDAQEVDVRGSQVSAAWPDRLSLTVEHAGETVRVQTQLLGVHTAVAVLAAVTTARALGVPLADAADAIATVAPADGRCSVHEADGVTFIRDDWKAPLWSLDATIDLMARARAARRILVIGTISDYPGASSPKYRAVARRAVAQVDELIFVGPAGHRAHLQDHVPGVTSFDTLETLHTHFATHLRAGDLVMLKGSFKADHLQRIVLARTGGVACWRSCGRSTSCTDCDLRFTPGR